MRPMYARHRLDIGLTDLASAAAATWRRSASPQPEPTGALRCLSVRSGFHLLLGALALPAGREAVFSALTHPAMPRLVDRLGLAPAPRDIVPATLAPPL